MAREIIGGLVRKDPHNKNYKELFNKVYQLSGSVNPVEPVETFDDLAIAHPEPVEGDAVYVIDEKIIYRWSHKDEKWQYFSDFTVLNDVIDDANSARDDAIEATGNANLATNKANTAATNAENKIDEMDTLKDTLNSNESERISNENIRETSESNRVSAENARKDNEVDRISSESGRKSAESSRVTAEQNRQSAESDRVTKENQRVSSESTRVSNESTRKTNESARQSSESTRVSNESTRKINETARQQAEDDREQAEGIRQSNEIVRIANNNTLVQRMQELEDIDSVHLESMIDSHKDDGGEHGKIARAIIGTSLAGWTTKDCDYLCDGTDDQVEINQAIQALPATGGEVFILDGVYNITDTITIHKNNVSIRGTGGSTVLKRMISSGQVIRLEEVEGCRVERVRIDGNRANYSGSYHAIYLNKSNYSFIMSNICENSSGDGVYGFLSHYNTISSNICDNNGNGIYLLDCRNNTITNNNNKNNSRYGIYVDTWSDNNIISNNICIRGTGTPSDYDELQGTIYLSGKFNNTIANLCMGKSVFDNGTGNSNFNNKWNDTDDFATHQAEYAALKQIVDNNTWRRIDTLSEKIEITSNDFANPTVIPLNEPYTTKNYMVEFSTSSDDRGIQYAFFKGSGGNSAGVVGTLGLTVMKVRSGGNIGFYDASGRLYVSAVYALGV